MNTNEYDKPDWQCIDRPGTAFWVNDSDGNQVFYDAERSAPARRAMERMVREINAMRVELTRLLQVEADWSRG